MEIILEIEEEILGKNKQINPTILGGGQEMCHGIDCTKFDLDLPISIVTRTTI